MNIYFLNSNTSKIKLNFILDIYFKKDFYYINSFDDINRSDCVYIICSNFNSNDTREYIFSNIGKAANLLILKKNDDDKYDINNMKFKHNVKQFNYIKNDLYIYSFPKSSLPYYSLGVKVAINIANNQIKLRLYCITTSSRCNIWYIFYKVRIT